MLTTLMLFWSLARAENVEDSGARPWRLMPSDCSPTGLRNVRPDPGIAAVFGGAVGYGAGHFYLHQPAAGIAFLGVDAFATGTLIAGPFVGRPYDSVRTPNLPLILGSTVVIGVSRLIQVAAGIDSANAQYDRMRRECAARGGSP